MSLNIRLKHSATKDKKPQAADLKTGELALNTNSASAAGYALDDTGAVQQMFGKATETQQGQAEIATQPEVDAGTDDERIVTPTKLAQRLNDFKSNDVDAAITAQAAQTAADIKVEADARVAADALKLDKTGGALTGPLTVPAGATGSAVPRADEVVKISGDTMTGDLTVPSLNGGQLAGLRNVLINGAVEINQRGVTYAAAAVGDYWADRWKKTAGGMTQIVEDGNYRPFTTYTLSGTGVTTQQITSPGAGNWTIPDVPSTATKIQLEEGAVATPFELRPIAMELSLCQRYYCFGNKIAASCFSVSAPGHSQLRGSAIRHPQPMRAVPTTAIYMGHLVDGANGTAGMAHIQLYEVGASSAGGGTDASAVVSDIVDLKNQMAIMHIRGYVNTSFGMFFYNYTADAEL